MNTAQVVMAGIALAVTMNVGAYLISYVRK